MKKYKPSRDLPRFALEHKTTSPTKLAEIVLKERNTEIKPQAVTMWFTRHPQVLTELEAKIVASQIDNKVVDPTIFNNGTFEKLETVKTWIEEMNDRDLRKDQIDDNVRALKRVCLGRFSNFKIDLVEEGLWCYKHPDRLTLDEGREIVRLMKAKDHDTVSIRLPLRNFLDSKGIHVGKKISGAKGKGFGKLARLFVRKAILNEMLQWVKAVNFEAYCIDLFMYKTGTRLTATLEARIENIREEGNYREIKVYDKGRKSKYPEGKPWDKHIPSDLWEALKPLIGDRKAGLIFNMSDRKLSKLNRAGLDKFVPELSKKIRKQNHFWRHMFFQHMLRATDWNYGASAELGGSTVKSLEESYGKPPRAVVKQWGLRYMPQL